MNENDFISYKINIFSTTGLILWLWPLLPSYSLAIAEEPSFLQAYMYVGGWNVHMDYLTEQEFTNKYVITVLLLKFSPSNYSAPFTAQAILLFSCRILEEVQ